MDPSLLIPSPDSLPVHWGWLQFLLVFTFIIHILIMNSMLGSAVIALVYSFSSKPEHLPTERAISRNLPYTIAFTINAGVAPLLFVQVIYGQFIYTSSVLMAAYWLSIVLFVMAAYYLAYIYDFKFEILGSGRCYLISGVVCLLLFTGFIFSNNFTLMLNPQKWPEYFNNSRGTILNLSDPTLYPRYLHFVFGSIAVGGLVLALYNKYMNKDGHSLYKKDKIKTGMIWFNHATIIQMIIGIWFLISLPNEILLLFMGKNLIATALLVFGIIFGFISLLFGFKTRVAACTVTTVITVSIMAIIREFLKSAYLKPYFSISSLQIKPQYSPFVMFLIVLIIGFFLIGYMLKLARQEPREDDI